MALKSVHAISGSDGQPLDGAGDATEAGTESLRTVSEAMPEVSAGMVWITPWNENSTYYLTPKLSTSVGQYVQGGIPEGLLQPHCKAGSVKLSALWEWGSRR